MAAASLFDMIVGTGGIGTGIFYELEGNHPIGSEESRRARRLDQVDACKQHIILHYLSVLLRDSGSSCRVIPIGSVGQDEAGHRLCGEMASAGMITRYVQQRKDASTLSVVCYVFPDGRGGNFTEAVSACEKVTPAVIDKAWRSLRPPRGRTMVLAAPEVPLETRLYLLEKGRAAGAFNVASLTTAEVPTAWRQAFLDKVDLLALNRDEAAALARLPDSVPAEKIVDACSVRLARRYPDLKLTVTFGREGAFAVVNGQKRHVPVFPAKVVNTAGAGDAFLSGVMLGQILGLPFLEGEASCLHLGVVMGCLKVSAADTLNKNINLKQVRAYLRRVRGQSLLNALPRSMS